MATNTVPPRYVSFSFWVFVIGIVLIFLAAFGIEAPVVNLFEGGVGLCFAAMLIR